MIRVRLHSKRVTFRPEVALGVFLREREQSDAVADLIEQGVGGARPEAYTPVIARGSDVLAVRALGNIVYGTVMALKSTERLTAGHFP